MLTLGMDVGLGIWIYLFGHTADGDTHGHGVHTLKHAHTFAQGRVTATPHCCDGCAHIHTRARAHTHSHTESHAIQTHTGTRDSRATLLLGSDGWVSHREGGVTFVLDVTRCMYSSGGQIHDTHMCVYMCVCTVYVYDM